MRSVGTRAGCHASPTRKNGRVDPSRRLAQERARTLERLDGLVDDFDAVTAASLDTNADDEHDPEGATIAFERSQVGALVRQARTHLREIDAALARVRDGSYGRCEGCGGVIAAERLEVRPAARTCVRCAAATRVPSSG